MAPSPSTTRTRCTLVCREIAHASKSCMYTPVQGGLRWLTLTVTCHASGAVGSAACNGAQRTAHHGVGCHHGSTGGAHASVPTSAILFISPSRRPVSAELSNDSSWGARHDQHINHALLEMHFQAEFPDFNPLLPPAGSPSAGRVRPLLRLERKLFGDWLRWLTSAW